MKNHEQRGLAMIEFLLVAPIILLLMVATAELGRGFLFYNALTKSVRDSARYAAEVATTAGGTTGVISINAAQQTAVKNLTVYGQTTNGSSAILPGLTPANVTVSGSTTGVVDVTATYNYQSIYSRIPMFGFGPDIVPSFTFVAHVTMRAL